MKKKNDYFLENNVNIVEKNNNIYEDAEAEAAPVVEAPVETPAAEAGPAPEADNASLLFEQRQKQYLKGRRATRTIMDNLGNIIIQEGAVIDDAVIDEAKSKGKLIELVMNNQA